MYFKKALMATRPWSFLKYGQQRFCAQMDLLLVRVNNNLAFVRLTAPRRYAHAVTAATPELVKVSIYLTKQLLEANKRVCHVYHFIRS